MEHTRDLTRAVLLKRLETEALQIRRNVWRAVRAGGSGHVGGSSSAADLLAALYFHRLNIRPGEPDWPDRDRLILSKGHAVPALYAKVDVGRLRQVAQPWPDAEPASC